MRDPSPDPLHPLEFRILLALLEGPAHGYRIVKTIVAREQGRTKPIYPANLYRRIRDLLARGWIEETAPPADEAEADPRRTYVAITAAGHAVAVAEARRLEELVADARALDLLDPAR